MPCAVPLTLDFTTPCFMHTGGRSDLCIMKVVPGCALVSPFASSRNTLPRSLTNIPHTHLVFLRLLRKGPDHGVVRTHCAEKRNDVLALRPLPVSALGIADLVVQLRRMRQVVLSIGRGHLLQLLDVRQYDTIRNSVAHDRCVQR